MFIDFYIGSLTDLWRKISSNEKSYLKTKNNSPKKKKKTPKQQKCIT